jgi:hypothetical protein
MRHPYFELQDVDRAFWAERIAPFLPDRIFDAHRHIALPEHLDPVSPERRQRDWTFEVARHESLEEAAVGYAQLFPDRSVSCLAFGYPHRECHLEDNNTYLADGLAGTGSAVLALTSPTWAAEDVARWLRQPGVIGIKPYQDLIPGFDGEDVSVFDFCPHAHLEVVNEVGGWLTLHLPRRERLADPDNIAEVLDIRQRYPRLVLVVAHIGRSYAGRFAREGLPALSRDEGILFDTSAVLNPAVYALALDRLGPQRLLFGSDFPILYMRGRQRWEGDRYINRTSGTYTWNVSREPPEVEATYTLYVYEAIAACVDTCRALGFDDAALRAIFHDNARAIVDRLLAEKVAW